MPVSPLPAVVGKNVAVGRKWSRFCRNEKMNVNKHSHLQEWLVLHFGPAIRMLTLSIETATPHSWTGTRQNSVILMSVSMPVNSCHNFVGSNHKLCMPFARPLPWITRVQHFDTFHCAPSSFTLKCPYQRNRTGSRCRTIFGPFGQRATSRAEPTRAPVRGLPRLSYRDH